MKHAYTLIPFLVVVISCATQPKQTGPEAILVQMRADTSWIHHLDSLAQTAIGPGAKCLDPVSHSFTYDGRTWIFNQDWGGVLEIPADYIIEDDLWQAKISFHGTHAWSPDSTILVSFYAGFQCLDKEEFTESILESLEEDGFTVFRRDEKEEVLTVFARSAQGINFVGRYLYTDEDGIEHCVSVQYPDGKAEEAIPVIAMASHYPLGPMTDSSVFSRHLFEILESFCNLVCSN